MRIADGVPHEVAPTGDVPNELPPLVPGSLTARTLYRMWRANIETSLTKAEMADEPNLLPTVAAHLNRRSGLSVYVDAPDEHRCAAVFAAIPRSYLSEVSGNWGMSENFTRRPWLPDFDDGRRFASKWWRRTHSARIVMATSIDERSLIVITGPRGAWLRTHYSASSANQPGYTYDVPLDVILAGASA